MDIHDKIRLGALLLLLTGVLLFSGCTQPSTVTAHPATPTATTAPPTVIPTTIAANETTKIEIAALAGTFAGKINGTVLQTALAEGPNSTAFTMMLQELKGLKASDNRIAYVYTLEQKNGTSRFIVDADYGLPDGSLYLQEYTDAPAELKTAVTVPIAIGPYTDRWGTFYSGFAPVTTGSKDSIILVGVDFRV